MILIRDGKRYDEKKFAIEADFEAEIVATKETIFGKDTIYIDANAYSDSSRTPVPIQVGQSFRLKSDTRSDSSRTPIPIKSDTPKRG